MAAIYVCDDNELDRLRLKKWIQQYFERNWISVEVIEFGEGKEMLANLQSDAEKPLLIFLDIYMENMDGIEVAREIRQREDMLPIIFTTSSGSHGLEAFSVFANGYLQKPYTQQDFVSAVEPYLERFEGEARCLTVKIRRDEVSIPLYRILYVESEGHSVNVHTISEVIRCNSSVSALRDVLCQEEAFLECGKSYVVNLNYVTGWNENVLFLPGDVEVYMPVRLVADLRKSAQTYRERCGMAFQKRDEERDWT